VTERVLAALDGYATEGGYDQAWGIATCFSPVVSLGRQPAPGAGVGLWPAFAGVVEAAQRAGVGLRITPEWARVEPRRGVVDHEALATYAGLVTRARNVGLDVTVCIVDAAWPAWGGQEAWLLPWFYEVLGEHVRRVAEAIPDVPLIVLADPGRTIEGGFRESLGPPWRRRARTEADYALHQFGTFIDSLHEDETLRPRLLASWRTVPAALHPAPADVVADEVHVTTLVTGAGPTTRDGLYDVVDGVWVPRPTRHS